jgi:AcrR family transcriptional regulator
VLDGGQGDFVTAASSAPRVVRKRRTPADAREQLLDATLELMATHGIAAFQINDVAAATQMSPATVLYHFGSRQALVSEALRFKNHRWFAEFKSHDDDAALLDLNSFITTALDPGARLVAQWERDWKVWFEALAAAMRDEDVRETIAQHDERWLAVIAEMLRREGVPRRRLSSAAASLSSVVDGLVMRLLIAPGSLTHRAAATIARKHGAALIG